MSEPVWNCRIHPTDWYHEVGCPHRLWTPEELRDGLVNFKLTGKPLTVQARNEVYCEEQASEN